MALPGVHLSKKRQKKLRGEKYNPLKPDYENKAQVAAAARQKAAGEVKPEVAALTSEGKEARRSNQGRTRQINNEYGAAETSVTAARENAQKAYDDYIATNNAASQANVASLQAALASTRSANLQQASTVGGVLGSGEEQPTLTAATQQATGQAGADNNLGLTALTGAQAAPVGFAIGKVNAQQDQAAKFRSLLDAIHEKRTAAKAKLGPAIEKAEQEINSEELAKASERNRENIAKGSLENEGKQVGVAETEAETSKYNAVTARKEAEQKAREAGVNSKLGWAAIHNEERKLKSEVGIAKSAAEKEAAEAAATKYSRAVTAMTNWISSNPKENLQRPRQLFNVLTSMMSPQEALELMQHSGSAKVQRFANAAISARARPKHEGTGTAQGHVHR